MTNQRIKSMRSDRIKLLDCTLRDGGQGLEAAFRIGTSSVRFTDDTIFRIIEHLVKTDIDIIELGYVDENVVCAGHPFANHSKLLDVSNFIPIKRNKNQLYISLFTGPNIDYNDIPEYTPQMVDGTRVILRYSELQRSIDFCKTLAKRGYKTFVQPMLTMRYSDDELKMLIEESNAMGAYALYIVDSFGYMKETDIERLFKLFDDGLDLSIRIGFHAHNNLNLAYSNVQHFLDISGDRNVIVDSTVSGMGQGAGNLQTELILPYLNQEYEKKYNFVELLEVCEQIEPLSSVYQWGYSVIWALPAIYKTAYKYAMVMRMIRGFSYSKINYVLQHMPDNLRHRYTEENLELAMKAAGIKE